jgi:hypothetical protein
MAGAPLRDAIVARSIGEDIRIERGCWSSA